MTTPKAQTIPSAEIELGGKVRTLRYDFNALCLLEETIGKSALDPTIFSHLRASEIRAFVWAGILHEDDNISLKDVGGWIHPAIMKEVAEAISKAFGASQAKAAPADPLEPTPETPAQLSTSESTS